MDRDKLGKGKWLVHLTHGIKLAVKSGAWGVIFP